ncbi:hypothetical protein PS467_23070 [Streptomyces luomodiensis]|uniref:DUF4232 domain-containing protein n=1 Tax=Streptomyces luomodiensis TaxID=3026192 RepID=A0ABY9UZH4_9ACTN|nr:hypothetical protein [Streptomyces sp. SCA4-21]WNE98001.1 hypothetical protein PS467_23070 [Streptomyces sp. SCA4-21]
MGSLRNPIGPLPSSIYWRRRAVALALLIAIVILVIWAFGWGGAGGGGSDEGKGSGGGGPASTITPGPSSSGPVNSERPGGRDESDGGGSGSGDSGGSGGSGGSDDGGTDESGGGAGGGSGSGGAGGSSGGSAGGADGIGTGTGQGLPAGSSLPDCRRGDVELTVRSVKDSKVKNTWAPDEKPTFEIVVKNTGSNSCKVDFGRAAASLTITDADNAHVWASGDCPEGSASALVEVPGSGQTKRTVEWDRKRSAEHCATPSGSASAKAGTYLVEAKVDGLGTAQVSFVLAKD